MDFRSLSRRELQALCKRNKIPANVTNVAMADALAALPSVEGLEEFLNGEGSGVPESPMKEEFVNSEVPRTALRTSTRRKTVKDEPITTRTRRAAAARCTEESENRDRNVALTTPSLPSSRRRTVTASSACKKVDFQMAVDVVEKEDDDLDQEKNGIEKTPAVPKSQKRVVGASARKRTETRNNGATSQRVYSTRRSVRLLEKNMESLSLGEDGKMEPITVHMSFDEMPNSTGPVKEDTNLEIESKKTDESESNLDEDLELKIDDQEKNEMESEVKHSQIEPESNLEIESKKTDESESKLVEDLELKIDDQEKNEMESEVKLSQIEPEMDLDSLNCSAENTETEVPDDNLDVKSLSEDDDQEANEDSKDDDAVEIPAEEINDSDKLSLPTEDVNLTEVHNSSIVEVSSSEVERNESICESECISDEDCEEETKLMNISAELSLSHENVEEDIQVDELMNHSAEFLSNMEEETQVDDGVLSSVEEESAMEEVKDSQIEYVYESEPTMEEEEEEVLVNADIEGDKKEKMDKEETVSVEADEEEDDTTINSMDFPENVSEELVDVKIQWQMEEEAPCEEVSVTSTEEIIPTSSNNTINGVQSSPSFAAADHQLAMANQFPRPTVETKSPLNKDQTIKLLINNSDVEDEADEKEEEKVNYIQRKIVDKNDMSLRQLRKMFKEQLQLSKKKMDNNNNTKVVGGGKVRTALQPLPENIIAMDEQEKRL